jgi:hypothetical protein
MYAAIFTEIKADWREPYADLVERIQNACERGEMLRPKLGFYLSDSPLAKFSSVERVVKRHPELSIFVRDETGPNGAATSTLTSFAMAIESMESLRPAVLKSIVSGIPKAYPFWEATFEFFPRSGASSILLSPYESTRSPVQLGQFASRVPLALSRSVRQKGTLFAPSLFVSDSWGRSHRNRSAIAITVQDIKLTENARKHSQESLRSISSVCGKLLKPTIIPLLRLETPAEFETARPTEQYLKVVADLIDDIEGNKERLVRQAKLPHDLPSAIMARKDTPAVLSSGAKRPDLISVFRPLGYSCKGGRGEFWLRKRTAKGLVLELYLDVGTWSDSLTAVYHVFGLGFRASLRLPLSMQELSCRQYPIGDLTRWRQLVENLAALVIELEQTLIPTFDAISEPLPTWFEPGL